MAKSEYTLREMIDCFETISRYGNKNGESSGMYGAAADKLRRLAMLEAMIERGELVRRGKG